MRILAGALAAALMIEGGGAVAGELNLKTVRVLEAPVERVWQALLDAEAVRAWWGPQGFTAPRVEMNVALGSSSLVCMTAPGFPLLCNSWTYTAIDAPTRLAFDQGFVDEVGAPVSPQSLGLPADIPAVVPHVVQLRALPEGRTELTWIEEGYASPATVAMSEAGLAQVLDKLAAFVAGQ